MEGNLVNQAASRHDQPVADVDIGLPARRRAAFAEAGGVIPIHHPCDGLSDGQADARLLSAERDYRSAESTDRLSDKVFP
jgi:hypothetical protein